MLRWLADKLDRHRLRSAGLTEEEIHAEGDKSPGVLMASGYIMMAHFWALQARAAERLLASGSGAQPAAFYQSKIDCAEFYFERMLPRADAHMRTALAPIRSLMKMDRESFRID